MDNWFFNNSAEKEENMNITEREWNAWQDIVKELRNLGVEINDQNKLNDLLKHWANEYCLLNKDILI